MSGLFDALRQLGQSFHAKLMLPVPVIWSVVVSALGAMLETQHIFVGIQQVSDAQLQTDDPNEKIKVRLAILEAIASGLDAAHLVAPDYAAHDLARRFALIASTDFRRVMSQLPDNPLVQ